MNRCAIAVLSVAVLFAWCAAPSSAAEKIRIACVGDSITANNYPADLGQHCSALKILTCALRRQRHDDAQGRAIPPIGKQANSAKCMSSSRKSS